MSELMREEGMKAARRSPTPQCQFFLNTHPSEVGTERLANSLRELRATYPDAAITIELHEAAVTDLPSVQAFKALLNDLQMPLSYDDFGAGQGRLLELVEVPPEVLKFDMALIRDIDSASGSRQDLVRSLVRLAQDCGTTALAEGVESEAEHQACIELGFELGQGFYYGRPAPFSAETSGDASFLQAVQVRPATVLDVLAG